MSRDTQGIVRITAALMMAIAMLLVGYLVFWAGAMVYAQRTLTSRIHEVFGGNIVYEAPSWRANPLQTTMVLRNITITTAPSQSGAWMQFNLPEIGVRSSFFDAKHHLVLTLPEQWTARLESPSRKETLTIQSQQGEMKLLMPADTLQVGLSADHLTIRDGKGGSILQLDNGFLNWMADRQNPTLKLGAQNIRSSAGPLDDLAVDIRMQRLFMVESMAWKVILQRTPESVRQLLNGLITLSQRGSELDVPHILIKKNGKSFSMFGNLDVAPEGTPEGDLTITAGRPSDLQEWIDATRLIQTTTQADAVRRQYVMKNLGADRPTANITFHQGIAIMNTHRVGTTPRLTDVVRQVGK